MSLRTKAEGQMHAQNEGLRGTEAPLGRQRGSPVHSIGAARHGAGRRKTGMAAKEGGRRLPAPRLVTVQEEGSERQEE